MGSRAASKIATASAAALLAAITATPAASASPAPSAEHFVMTFETINGIDRTTRVSATGPIQGAGTETQTDQDTPDGDVVTFTWHLGGGTVTLQAVENYTFTPDYTSCTAKAVGTGTWTITGGTGSFAGATGQGTFTSDGSFTGARDAHGVCDPQAMPRTSIFIVRGLGNANLPTS